MTDDDRVAELEGLLRELADAVTECRLRCECDLGNEWPALKRRIVEALERGHKGESFPNADDERTMLKDAALLESEFVPTSAGHDAACHIKALLSTIHQLRVDVGGMNESTTCTHSLLDGLDIPRKGPFEALSIGDRVTILEAMYKSMCGALDVNRREVDRLTAQLLILTGATRPLHSPDCGTKYRGCAPDCPKDIAEREAKP